MCECTPTIRTPFCGRGNCIPPQLRKQAGQRQAPVTAPVVTPATSTSTPEPIAPQAPTCVVEEGFCFTHGTQAPCKYGAPAAD